MGTWERIKTTDSATDREYVPDTERYASSVVNPYIRDGRVIPENERTPFQWCSRARCQELVHMQRENTLDSHGARHWRYRSDVVVVSLEDGSVKNAYCSVKCAALALTALGK